MKRWRVELEVTTGDAEVYAATEEEAKRLAERDVNSWDFDVCAVRAVEIPYLRPAGTDRWAVVAEELRFAEDRPSSWFSGEDGFWWWTNGHVALKCIAPPPSGDAVKSTNASLAALVGDHAREPVMLGAKRKDGRVETRRALESDGVAIDDRYARLVQSGMFGRPVRWMAAATHREPWTVPVLAYDGDEIVAVVMGVRPERSR